MEAITYNHLALFEKFPAVKEEKSNFRISFSFLPRDERAAMNSVYAFCSYIDSIVDRNPLADENSSLRYQRLKWWEDVVDQIYEDEISNPLILPFIKAIKRFRIPKQYLITVIDGCRRDLNQKRYGTFQELKEYCYSVASVVGLISIEVFGYKYEETKNYAINLGYALQLTNILRDIKADKDRGYIYLPKEDMDKFGYSESDLMNEIYNQNFVELMRFESQRARQYYHKARRLLHPEERITTFAAGIMDEIYFRILEKIELSEYNIFTKKIRVSQVHKLMITLKHWLSLAMFIKPRKKK